MSARILIPTNELRKESLAEHCDKDDMKEATLRMLAAIQPIRYLKYLTSQIVEALAQETGVPTSDGAYAHLTNIQKHIDLAHLDWGTFSLSLGTKAISDVDTTEIALDCARLLLDRAEVQAALYVGAKHFFTLSISHRYRLPQAVPREKLPEWEDFNYSMRLGDTFLDNGRAKLKEFEKLLQQGAPFSQMRSVLNQAHEQALSYQHAQEHGNRIYESLYADLALVKQKREPLVA